MKKQEIDFLDLWFEYRYIHYSIDECTKNFIDLISYLKNFIKDNNLEVAIYPDNKQKSREMLSRAIDELLKSEKYTRLKNELEQNDCLRWLDSFKETLYKLLNIYM